MQNQPEVFTSLKYDNVRVLATVHEKQDVSPHHGV